MFLEILGYAGAVLMGLSLGFIGGGGSILTVPILVYLFPIDPVTATAYSLFVVGLTSLAGSVTHIRMGNIHWRSAVLFGIPSIISVYLTRAFLVPSMPDPIISTSSLTISKGHFLLLLFALIMLVASYTMIRKSKNEQSPVKNGERHLGLILLEGSIVGVFTGLVGAGGGFLIIPALVLLAGLPMKQAVGTSLVIISAKSLIGFTGDLSVSRFVNWPFLLTFSGIAIAGIITGSILSKRVSNEKLKPAFGYFILVMGIYIIIRELVHTSS